MESYQSCSDPAAGGKPRNMVSRIFHFIIVLFYLTLLVLSLVSLGNFATQHNKFRKVTGGCLLFDTKSGSKPEVNKSHVCGFVIWGEAIVAVIAVVLGLLAVVKMANGRRAVSLLAVAELVTIIIGTLLGLTISIVISIGIRQTCDVVETSCDEIPYVKRVPVSEVTAWIETGVVFFLGLLYIGILIVYCMRASNRKETETLLQSTKPHSGYLDAPTV